MNNGSLDHHMTAPVVWGRLYLEDVEGGQGIDQAVQHMARGTE
jgi:hypothetical protein